MARLFIQLCLKIVCVSVTLVTGINIIQAQSISIIPQPVFVQKGTGSFQILPATKILYNKAAGSTASFLSELLRKSTGYRMPLEITTAPGSQPAIYLIVNERFADTTTGAYSLEVNSRSIVAEARGHAGLFYAIQSLRQLLPTAVEISSVQKIRVG
ncbi:glycoside hydrolase family 20 zincin-like fold domain-containing protein [Niabella hibiscisoli]|uniref:glycoside hydrolase family 20 zincin-like fold domain-containing protein n=1 Tax=Niabella hibiscisoli TaxID=1825928 RepID=UPI001F0FC308|nr:glycoside hydrolase family 20 zincin-like fold domain-containing protein [Niabella hibiscisoli]MCH5718928.1 glycoside hydrolase family 20 zincin-like fold domain-containing protein [Niabella hibiscisoli]